MPGHKYMIRFASAAAMCCVARRKNTADLDSPQANATAGIHDRHDHGATAVDALDGSMWLRVSHPMEKPIVRYSNAGISRVCSESAGHVAQSGIARPPASVQTQGGRRRRAVREPDLPKMT